MSSSPAAEPVRRRRGPAGWSLRARLVAALVGLLAVVCAVIAIATTIAVYEFQVRQLDARLMSAGNRTFTALHPPDSDHGPPGGPIAPPGQGPGTVSAHVHDGQFDYAAVVGIDGTPVALSSAQTTTLANLPIQQKPSTTSISGLGDYRLVVSRAPDGDLLITGLPMADVYATRDWLITLELTIGFGALLLAAALGTVIIRGTLRPLRRVAATARRVAELPLDRGEVALSVRVPDVDTDPRTEVGQVGAALNRMLGHVADALAARQASETRVRHFVADASHELRTPLAAIRGYAELTRRVPDEVPEAVAHAMRRVESETDRMTTLVEDMLLLARLDSGRPLVREPVDLSRLVIDAVSDAHAAAPGHHWHLDLPAESVVVPGDPARLHQILGNLLANARTHTPAGTTVTTALAVAGPSATLRVTDNGPGIPESLLPEVFDRFARGDTSRSRAAGSTGLGLAIVAAVVEAHQGTVEVTSRPGHTEFSVRLPLTPAQPTHKQNHVRVWGGGDP
jgi:two-component system OmpR family sensor kinase